MRIKALESIILHVLSQLNISKKALAPKIIYLISRFSSVYLGECARPTHMECVGTSWSIKSFPSWVIDFIPKAEKLTQKCGMFENRTHT